MSGLSFENYLIHRNSFVFYCKIVIFYLKLLNQQLKYLKETDIYGGFRA